MLFVSVIRHKYLGIVIAAVALSLMGCAPTFRHVDILEQRSTRTPQLLTPKAAIVNFQLRRLGGEFEEDTDIRNMRQSFANAIYNSGSFSDITAFPDTNAWKDDAINFDIALTPSFQQSFDPWYWYIGILAGLGPLWPAMPRKGVIALQMDVGVYKGKIKIQNVSMTEEEPFDYFWYGPYQFFDLEDHTTHLYRKLLARLTLLMTTQPPIGDASGLVEEVSEKPSSNISADKPIKSLSVAVMDPECNGIDSILAQTLNTKLRTELFNTGAFQIMERSRMQDILLEQGFQESGACDNTECYVKVGQLVGVDAILVSSYGKAGSITLITLRTISVVTGQVLDEVSTEVTGGDELLLTQGIPTVVRKIHMERIQEPSSL